MRFLRRKQPQVEEAQISAVFDELAPRLERYTVSPDGKPVSYPDSAAPALVKMELAEVLGLMDDVMAVTDPGLANKRLSGEKLSQRDYGRLEAEYDRVFKAHRLTSLVDEVVRRALV